MQNKCNTNRVMLNVTKTMEIIIGSYFILPLSLIFIYHMKHIGKKLQAKPQSIYCMTDINKCLLPKYKSTFKETFVLQN